MLAWLLSVALATEPVRVDPAAPPAPAPDRAGATERVLPWAEVGFRPAAPESPALGPDRLALGPAGRAALYDPVGARILQVDGAAFSATGVDGLAYGAAGILLVLDEGARQLRSHDETGRLLDVRALPGVVPHGGALRVAGERVYSVDLFGNAHPVATVDARGALGAPAAQDLVPRARSLRRKGNAIEVDGRTVAVLAGRGGARLLGDWLLVEAVTDGSVARTAIPLGGGAPVALPARGRLYAPSEDVAVGPDGTLGWIDPRADGLHLVRVAP